MFVPKSLPLEALPAPQPNSTSFSTLTPDDLVSPVENETTAGIFAASIVVAASFAFIAFMAAGIYNVNHNGLLIELSETGVSAAAQ